MTIITVYKSIMEDKKMKTIKLILLCTALTLSLASCGMNDGKISETQAPTATQSTDNVENDIRDVGDDAGNAVKDVGDAAGDVVEGVGDAAGDVVEGVDNAVTNE